MCVHQLLSRTQCSKIWTLNDLSTFEPFGSVKEVSKRMCAVGGNEIVHYVAIETVGKMTQLTIFIYK